MTNLTGISQFFYEITLSQSLGPTTLCQFSFYFIFHASVSTHLELLFLTVLALPNASRTGLDCKVINTGAKMRKQLPILLKSYISNETGNKMK